MSATSTWRRCRSSAISFKERMKSTISPTRKMCIKVTQLIIDGHLVDHERKTNNISPHINTRVNHIINQNKHSISSSKVPKQQRYSVQERRFNEKSNSGFFQTLCSFFPFLRRLFHFIRNGDMIGCNALLGSADDIIHLPSCNSASSSPCCQTLYLRKNLI